MAGSAAARAATRPSKAARPRPTRPPAPPEAERSRRAVRARPRVRGGVLWILVVGGLLAGIVALNVAVLALRVDAEQLEADLQKLETRSATLVSQLSSATAAGRIEDLAISRLGLVPPAETAYLRLKR